MDKPTRLIDTCAPPSCSCPTAEMYDTTREIVIKDDYNGTVKMTYTQFHRIAEQFLEHV